LICTVLLEPFNLYAVGAVPRGLSKAVKTLITYNLAQTLCVDLELDRGRLR
jgi:hypothetical protein